MIGNSTTRTGGTVNGYRFSDSRDSEKLIILIEAGHSSGESPPCETQLGIR